MSSVAMNENKQTLYKAADLRYVTGAAGMATFYKYLFASSCSF